MFIVFEGIDGAGTTTQAAKLASWFCDRGDRVYLTYEPNCDTEPGRFVRRILSTSMPFPAAALEALFAADRIIHVDDMIVPAIERGNVVVCDRYVPSGLAYTDIDDGVFLGINAHALELVPDYVFWIRTPVSVAMERVMSRQGNAELYENEPKQLRVHERYEQMFCPLIERGFEPRLPDAYRGRVVIVDGTLSIDEIHGIVTRFIEVRL